MTRRKSSHLSPRTGHNKARSSKMSGWTGQDTGVTLNLSGSPGQNGRSEFASVAYVYLDDSVCQSRKALWNARGKGHSGRRISGRLPKA